MPGQSYRHGVCARHFSDKPSGSRPTIIEVPTGALGAPNQVVAMLSGAVPPPRTVPTLPAPPQPHPPHAVPALPAVPVLPAPPPPPVVPMRTYGYVAPPNAARDRPYHPITDCLLDEYGYDGSDDEVDMTNITLGVFTYGNTDSDEEGQTLTTRHTLPPQVEIPKLVWDCASTAHIVVRADAR